MSDQQVVNVYRRPLGVYILWHPKSDRAGELARDLFRHLCQNPDRPLERGLQIPVRFRSSRGFGQPGLPAPVPLDTAVHASAERTGIVALVDDEMVLDRSVWGDYVADIWRRCQDPASPHRLFPVKLSTSAVKLHRELADSQFIGLPAEHTTQVLCNRVTHELCRLILDEPRGSEADVSASGAAPVKIFLSHAKRDGLAIAESIRDYIGARMKLKTFFDAVDIPDGSRWRDVLIEESGRLALLAIQTDAYATRPWCQREILNAKEHGVPIVVLNALSSGEKRGFPYLGNTPTVRWIENDANRFEDVLGTLLTEVLRSAYFERRMESLRRLFDIPSDQVSLAYPPELLTAVELRRHGRLKPGDVVVYPDPPLGSDEAERLRAVEADIQYITPTMVPAYFGIPSR